MFNVQSVEQVLPLGAARPHRIEWAMDGDLVEVRRHVEPLRIWPGSERAQRGAEISKTGGPSAGHQQAGGKVEAHEEGSVCFAAVS